MFDYPLFLITGVMVKRSSGVYLGVEQAISRQQWHRSERAVCERKISAYPVLTNQTTPTSKVSPQLTIILQIRRLLDDNRDAIDIS